MASVRPGEYIQLGKKKIKFRRALFGISQEKHTLVMALGDTFYMRGYVRHEARQGVDFTHFRGESSITPIYVLRYSGVYLLVK